MPCYVLLSDHMLYRLEELAAPYIILKEAGYDVTIASVKGGNIPLDPTSMKPENSQHGLTKKFLDNSTFTLAALPVLWCC